MKKKSIDSLSKQKRYAIRKLAVGTCSVAIGTLIFMANSVQAQELPEPEVSPTVTAPVVVAEHTGTESPTDTPTTTDSVPQAETAVVAEAPTVPVAETVNTAETAAPTPSEAETATPSTTPTPTAEPAEAPTVANPSPAQPTAPATPETTSPNATPTASRNVFEGATAQASQVETGTSFTGSLAVDGNLSTRWATDRNAAQPTLDIVLPESRHIEKLELYWDPRNGDPNVRGWEFLYSLTSTDGTAAGVEHWQSAHMRSGAPREHEIINLANGIDGRYFRLRVTDYVAGNLNWANVSLAEIKAYETANRSSTPETLQDISALTIDQATGRVVLPTLAHGNVSITGTNAYGVIDLTGKVYRPLTSKDVKLFLEHRIDNRVETREFIVRVEGQYADEGVGTKPTVVPIVQQWHGVEGSTSITQATTLVSQNDLFAGVVSQYQKDLATRGLNLALGNENDGQRIVFKLVTDKGYGAEGYGIQLHNGVITIEAATKVGALYATRTLLQMGETDLQNGEMKDYPTFGHRGFMLDTGRKFVPYKTIMNILENMAYYKMNDLQLHLNDNYIFLKEHLKGKNLSDEEALQYVLNNAATGFRLETDIVGSNGVKLTSKDHYTTEEFRNILRRADELGINLVPEIDTPGHALSFVKIRPDLMYKGDVGRHHNVERVAMLDLSPEKYDETLAFIKGVYDKLLAGPLKGVKTLHIGTDEYYGDAESYRRFANDMLQYIKSKGITPRIWGSLTLKRGSTPVDFQGVEVDVWSVYWQRPKEALDMGAKIINITDSPTYSVPDGSGSSRGYGDYNDYRTLYQHWTPNDFRTGGAELFEASNPNITGGGFAIWNDNVDLHETGITSFDMFYRFMVMMEASAEKTWLSDRRGNTTYQDRPVLEGDYYYAPGTDAEFKSHTKIDVTLNQKTFKNFKTNAKQTSHGLLFNPQSTLSIGVDRMPMTSTLKLDLTLTRDGVQVFSTNGQDKIYLRDAQGKIAYQFEQFLIQYDAQLELGKRTELVFVSGYQFTDLYINGVKQSIIPQAAHPKLAHTTFIKPVQTIGGFSGFLHELSLSDAPYVSPLNVTRDELASVSASSEEVDNATEYEGSVELAFDGNRHTIWHSHWQNKADHYTISARLKTPTLLSGLRYVPRSDSSQNGNVTAYEVYALINDQRVKVAEGRREADKQAHYIAFAEPVMTHQIEFVILTGKGDFGTAAEIELVKVYKSTHQTQAEMYEPSVTTVTGTVGSLTVEAVQKAVDTTTLPFDATVSVDAQALAALTADATSITAVVHYIDGSTDQVVVPVKLSEATKAYHFEAEGIKVEVEGTAAELKGLSLGVNKHVTLSDVDQLIDPELKTKTLDIYELHFANQQGDEVKLNKPMRVTFPKRAGMAVAHVYYIDPTHPDEVLTIAEATDTGVTVNLGHFSYYAVVYKDNVTQPTDPVVPNQPETPETPQTPQIPNQTPDKGQTNTIKPNQSTEVPKVLLNQPQQPKVIAGQLSKEMPTSQASALPQTGEVDYGAVFGVAALSIMTGLGLIVQAKKPEDER